eukprot:2384259-Prymnesium_polylepis.3
MRRKGRTLPSALEALHPAARSLCAVAIPHLAQICAVLSHGLPSLDGGALHASFCCARPSRELRSWPTSTADSMPPPRPRSNSIPRGTGRSPATTATRQRQRCAAVGQQLEGFPACHAGSSGGRWRAPTWRAGLAQPLRQHSTGAHPTGGQNRATTSPSAPPRGHSCVCCPRACARPVLRLVRRLSAGQERPHLRRSAQAHPIRARSRPKTRQHRDFAA